MPLKDLRLPQILRFSQSLMKSLQQQASCPDKCHSVREACGRMTPSTLPEIIEIEKLITEFQSVLHVRLLGHVGDKDKKFPSYLLSIGNQDPDAPALGWVGGVHGLERIGSQVVIALLKSVLQMQLWDESLQETLKKIRIFFVPTVNPWGMYNRRRSNSAGVDLMRNAPIDGEGKIPYLLGGHRFSANLPWYRGEVFQQENLLLQSAIENQVMGSKFSWSVDVHSGFGWQDQIWFPFAKSKIPFDDLSYLYRFKTFYESTHPYHFYKFEPQSYQTHGDVWDYFYLMMKSRGQRFMPLTLELGSWNWLKKNPLQILSREGLFYPFQPHRQKRILRRHWTLFDFMIRMTASYDKWAVLDAEQFEQARSNAMELWYDK